MRQHRLHVEGGVDSDRFDVLQLRLPVGAIFDDLVVGARAARNAPRSAPALARSRRQLQKLPREPTCNDGTGDAVRGRSTAADDGVCRRATISRPAIAGIENFILQNSRCTGQAKRRFGWFRSAIPC